MKKVKLITDGACKGNPGRGGWATILRYGNHKKEIWGSSPLTTNNRMEMAAAIEGLRALKEPCEAEIVTDSEYLKNGITKWVPNWKRRGWITAAKTPVLNRDLWQELDELAARHKASWSWTKGHASHADNNRADELASRAAEEQGFSDGMNPKLQSAKYALQKNHDANRGVPSLFDTGPGAVEP